ncbi:MAG: tetratricopeptide repeat protein [Planctomycetes bacterium]|nr:tetratricopeptide repeat protein [Planctomycetota bacterium]
MRRRPAWWVGVLLALAACGVASPELPPRTEARYDQCQDPGGQQALATAKALLGRREPRQALPYLRAVTGLCPDFVPGHMLLQDTALELRGQEEREIRDLYRGWPEDNALRCFLKARVADDDLERRELLERAIAFDRSFGYAHLSYARGLCAVRKYDLAIRSYEAALAAQPELHEARFELAAVLAEQGRERDAEKALQVYVTARPDDLDAKRRLARLRTYELERPADARPLLIELVRADPDDQGARMDLAAAHWQMGEHTAALAEYREVLRRDPNQARAVLNIANLHYEALAQGGETERKASLAKARAAYRYFLKIERPEGMFDMLDFYLSVPARLKYIDGVLGPYLGRDPDPSDF